MQNLENMGLTDGSGGRGPVLERLAVRCMDASGRSGPRVTLPGDQFSKIRIILQITSAFLCYR